MSNTQRAQFGKPVVPSGDFGLGLCLQCLGEIIANPDAAPSPQLAVTLAPMLYPPGNPVGMVAAPACWEHVKGQGEAAGRKPLLMANGRL